MHVLQLMKMHLIVLLCGVVAITAIVFCVLGMTSKAVVAQMEKVVRDTGADSIDRLKSKPRNEESIAQKKREGELFESEYAKTVEVANSINARKVLMGGVFPLPEKTATPFEFREAYKQTMKVLWTKLDAGTLPTQAEIEEEVQNVADLIDLEAEKKAEEEGDEVGRATRATPSGRTPIIPAFGGRSPLVPPGYPSGRVAPSSRMPPGEGVAAGIPSRMPSGAAGRTPMAARPPMGSSGEPKYDPVYRAQVAKARSILCYYDEASFHHSPLEFEEDAPTPAEMWFAQVALWVQEDVVKAIAKLNREAADRVTGGDACVEHVPVKRLVFLRVRGYELPGPQGLVIFPEAAGLRAVEVPPPGPSLTGRTSNEQYDVIRFVLSVVIDQRDILQLIDRITRVNFYQCLSVSYEVVNSQQETNLGYFYGTDPVVKATLEFEGYVARDVYRELMPPEVRKMLGIDTEGD